MLVCILFDAQYLHNDVFNFEKGLTHQIYSLNSHNPTKNSSSKISLSLSLLSIWKILIHFRVFFVFTIYFNNDMFEADLFILCKNDACLLYQYTMSKKLDETLYKKL